MATIISATDVVMVRALTLGTIMEINECTISGAAKRCSQNAQSARRVSRSRSDMSKLMAAAKTPSPHSRSTKDCAAGPPISVLAAHVGRPRARVAVEVPVMASVAVAPPVAVAAVPVAPVPVPVAVAVVVPVAAPVVPAPTIVGEEALRYTRGS